MTHGIRITNPSNELVFDVGGSGHTYRGTATLQAAQSWQTNQLYPYEFRWTAPNNTATPVIGLPVNETSVVYLDYITRLSSGSATWQIFVFSVTNATRLSASGPTGVQPVVHVWYPGANTVPYGVRLYAPNGTTVTYDLATGPLFIKEYAVFPQRAYENFEGTSPSGDVLAWDGDSQPFSSGLTNPVVVGSTGGFAQTYTYSSGEPDLNFVYGWRRSGSTMRRERLVWLDDQPFDVGDSIQAALAATRCAIIDPANLTT